MPRRFADLVDRPLKDQRERFPRSNAEWELLAHAILARCLH